MGGGQGREILSKWGRGGGLQVTGVRSVFFGGGGGDTLRGYPGVTAELGV